MLHDYVEFFGSILFEVDPLHALVEVSLFLFIVYLLLQKSYKIKELPDKLTEQEVSQLVEEWEPEPLIPPMNELQKWNHQHGQPKTLVSAPTAVMQLEGGEKVLNFATTNYFGLATDDTTKEAAIEALRTYGCGSCGPRGFYGTMDKHIDCERQLANFMGTEEAIIYSSGFAGIASAIPAFCKVFDLIICDAGVNHAVQTGVNLSRSKVMYFPHNDITALKKILAKTKEDDVNQKKKVYRKFVVIEGLYVNYGDLAPLDEIIKLKDQYKFRIVMDDSHGLGTLGKTGKGTCEHYGLSPYCVDILLSSMSHSIGSLGGFCAGKRPVVFHQRLSGSGYCFSASSPPYLVAGALRALTEMQSKNGQLQTALQDRISTFHKALEGIEKVGLRVRGDGFNRSPLIHLEIIESVLEDKLNRMTKEEDEQRKEKQKSKLEERFGTTGSVKGTKAQEQLKKRVKEESLLQAIVDEALQRSVFLLRPSYTDQEKFMPRPSIRIAISTQHDNKQLSKAASVIQGCADKVLNG